MPSDFRADVTKEMTARAFGRRLDGRKVEKGGLI